MLRDYGAQQLLKAMDFLDFGAPLLRLNNIARGLFLSLLLTPFLTSPSRPKMGGGGGKPQNIFKLNRGDDPKEVLNWRLWFAVSSACLQSQSNNNKYH